MTGKLFVPSTQLLRFLSRPLQASSASSTHLHHQSFSTSPPRHAKKPHLTPELDHLRYRDGELQPRPLSRPLGLPYPPQLNQNTGRDTRTLRQKRDDFADYGKHKQRREKLLSDVFERNYYRDMGNLGKVWKGKSILSPPTPYKKEVALFFPNLEGMTLEGRGIGRGKKWGQTTPVLKGKVSIVSLVHTTWAEEQVGSFMSREENPAVQDIVEGSRGTAQFVTVNVEENPLKAFLVRAFFGSLRRRVGKERWGKYFLNRRGLGEDIRDALAMWNSKVGYIYLVDGECKVRWAGNGFAQQQEKESIVRSLKRLVDEARGVKSTPPIRREEPRQSEREHIEKEEAMALSEKQAAPAT